MNYVRYTPDGKTVPTAGQDNVFKLWDRQTGKEVRRIALKDPVAPPGGRPAAVGWAVQGLRLQKVAMSDDGKLLASVLANNHIQLWNVETGNAIRQFKGPSVRLNSAFYSRPTANRWPVPHVPSRHLYLLEAETGKVLRQFKAQQPKAGVRIAFGGRQLIEANGSPSPPDGKTIATAESKSTSKDRHLLKITETKTGNEIRRSMTAQGGIASIAYFGRRQGPCLRQQPEVHLREAGAARRFARLH